MDITSRRPPNQGKLKPPLTEEDALRIVNRRKQQIARHVEHLSKNQNPAATKEKTRTRSKSRTKKDTTGVKIIVRLLPPEVKEDEVWMKFNIKASDPSSKINPGVLSMYFIQGRYSAKPFKAPIYSRAYIQFKNADIAQNFVQVFSNIVFEDEKESMSPVFSKCIYPKMPDVSFFGESSNEPKKVNLCDLPEYQLFLKYQAGEVERPDTFLATSKSKGKKVKEKQRAEDKKAKQAEVKENKETETKTKTKSKKSKAAKSKAKESTEKIPSSSINNNIEKKSIEKEKSPAAPKPKPKPKSKAKSKPAKITPSEQLTPTTSNTTTKKDAMKPNEKKSTDKKPETKKPLKKTDNSPPPQQNKNSESVNKPKKSFKTEQNKPVSSLVESKPTLKKILKKDNNNSTIDSKPKPKMILKRPTS